MKKSIRYGIIAAAVLALAYPTANWVIANLLDLNRYKGYLTELVEAETGRSLEIGDIQATFSLIPAVELHDIILSNAKWGKAPYLAKIGRAHVTLALKPLLTGNVEIRAITLDGVTLMLEESGAGKQNWQMKPASKKESTEAKKTQANGLEVLRGGTLQMEHGVIHYANTGTQDKHSLKITSLKLDATALDEAYPVFNLSSAMHYNNMPVQLKGQLALPAPQMFKLTSMNLKLADDAIRGDIEATLRGERPHIKANLTTEHLNISALQAAAASSAAEEKAITTDAPSQEAQPVFSNTSLPVSALKATDAEWTLKATSIKYKTLEMHDLETHGSLHVGSLKLPDLKFGIADGRVQGSIEFRTTHLPPSFNITMTGLNIDSGKLLNQLNEKSELEDGKLQFFAKLEGLGNTPHDLAASLKGDFTAYIAEGSYNKKIDFGDATQFFQLLAGGKKAKATVFECAAGSFTVNAGKAKTRALVLDSSGAVVRGSGYIDLGEEKLALVLKPQSRTAGLADLVTPMRLGGTFTKPRLYPDPQGTLMEAGKIALGLATGAGVAGIVAMKMAEKVTLEADNYCLAAFKKEGIALPSETNQ